jgi:HSP20 family molecular chaperone IbpA
MKKIFFVFFFLSTHLFAQTVVLQQQQANTQIEEIMRAREEMLKALMDDSMSGSLEKRMQDMMKNFDDGDDFGFGQMEGPVVGEYDWLENENSKTLKIKVKQIKDHPLDIKIQKGEIKIKGDVEATEGNGKHKSISKISFERSFGLPDDVDQNNPEFENKNGEMLIKFKKLKGKTTSKILKNSGVSSIKDTQIPTKKTKSTEDRIPVTPDKDDLSI